MTPKPRDPRTPLERNRDQLAAARKQLIGDEYLSRRTRQQLSDRIWELTKERQTLLVGQKQAHSGT